MLGWMRPCTAWSDLGANPALRGAWAKDLQIPVDQNCARTLFLFQCALCSASRTAPSDVGGGRASATSRSLCQQRRCCGTGGGVKPALPGDSARSCWRRVSREGPVRPPGCGHAALLSLTDVVPLGAGELEISQRHEGGIMCPQGGSDWRVSQ